MTIEFVDRWRKGDSLKRQSLEDALWRLGMVWITFTIPKPSALRLPPLQYGDFYGYRKVDCNLDGD